MADFDEYPNEHTRNVLEWCEKVDGIRVDDDQALPRLLKGADTKTLMGVFEHYEDILEDHEKLGDDEVPFGEWDHTVREAVRQELMSRGLKPVPRGFEGDTGQIVDQPNPGQPTN